MANFSHHQPQLINVTHESASKCVLQLVIPENLECLKGHFPEFAILPGVIQLQWAVNFANQYLKITAPVPTVDRLKFTAPIKPLTQLELSLEYFAEAGYTEFKYFNSEHQFSQGRLSHG